MSQQGRPISAREQLEHRIQPRRHLLYRHHVGSRRCEFYGEWQPIESLANSSYRLSVMGSELEIGVN